MLVAMRNGLAILAYEASVSSSFDASVPIVIEVRGSSRERLNEKATGRHHQGEKCNSCFHLETPFSSFLLVGCARAQ
jgi:hypothetical protein